VKENEGEWKASEKAREKVEEKKYFLLVVEIFLMPESKQNQEK